MSKYTAAGFAAEHGKLAKLTAQIVTEYVRSLDDAAVCSAASVQDLAALYDIPLPREGVTPDEILETLRRDILPHAMNISSPRYFGLFNPAPLPITVWVDAICSAINQNAAGWRNSPSASLLESRVLTWLCRLVGFGESGFGTLTSGGSEANLVALKCARDRAAGWDGLGAHPTRLRIYSSEQCHYSVVKSADILGMGRAGVRKIETDDAFRVRPHVLRQAVEQDIAEGYRPCAVVGVAGATSTGAIDPLGELADLAAEYGLWYHVDAAYGGALSFSPRYRGALDGIARADSVTLDPHKWMFVPFACGAVLTRRGPQVLRDAFDVTPEYLSEQRADDTGDDGTLDFFRYGQLGTRRANALKLWAALRNLGQDGYRQIVEAQVDLTHHLAAELAKLVDFEVVGRVQTAVCCARFIPRWARNLSTKEQDDLQLALQQRIERGGRAWLATTVLHGRRALRININGLLTTREHVDQLIQLLHNEATGYSSAR